MKKAGFYLKIVLAISIAAIILANPTLTGNSIISLGIFEVTFTRILILVLSFVLIFVFALEKVVEEVTEPKQGRYKGIQYRFYEAAGSKKVVLIAPGMGKKELESNTAVRALAERLARKGVSSITFEIQPDEKAPSPRGVIMDYLKMASLSKEMGYDHVHGIYGSSLSAGPALVVAGKLGIKNVALRSPLVFFHDLFDEAIKSRGGKPEEVVQRWEKAGRIPKGDSTLPFGLYKQFRDTDVEKVASRLNGTKIEITHGTLDETVPIQYAEKALEKLRQAGASVRFDRIEGAAHNYDKSQQKYAVKRLAKSLT